MSKYKELLDRIDQRNYLTEREHREFLEELKKACNKAEKYDEINKMVEYQDKSIGVAYIVNLQSEVKRIVEENKILKDGIKALRMLTAFDVFDKPHPTNTDDLCIPSAVNKHKGELSPIEAINKETNLIQYFISIYYSVDKCAMRKEMTKDVYDKIKTMLEVMDDESI